ncbi:MAG: type II toxin-antitoxin system RelE/ParE family toxin [Deltaproteobacteria bacterium]|nr:type II toxin-antitoxin system RelE/ParE family toxin [Deltaproteobacteria bacterium]
MDIIFKTTKMAKIFNSLKLLIKEYGPDKAKKIKMRRDFLEAAENLGQVPALRPHHRHELTGNRKGLFAVDLTGNYRLVFAPNHDPLPKRDDGGLDLEHITAIKILAVEDYHGD